MVGTAGVQYETGKKLEVMHGMKELATIHRQLPPRWNYYMRETHRLIGLELPRGIVQPMPVVAWASSILQNWRDAIRHVPFKCSVLRAQPENTGKLARSNVYSTFICTARHAFPAAADTPGTYHVVDVTQQEPVSGVTRP